MPTMSKGRRGSGSWVSPDVRPRAARWEGGDGPACTVCGAPTALALEADGYADHPTCDPEFLDLLERARQREAAS